MSDCLFISPEDAYKLARELDEARAEMDALRAERDTALARVAGACAEAYADGRVDARQACRERDAALAKLKDTEAERDRYREGLAMIARAPTTELNPDGVDQAAWSMQLIAEAALAAPVPDPKETT